MVLLFLVVSEEILITMVTSLWNVYFHSDVLNTTLYGSWMCNQCLSPLTLWVLILVMVRCTRTTLCDKVCQWLTAGQWFSPVSSTNKIDCHNITEILFESGGKHHKPKPKPHSAFYLLESNNLIRIFKHQWSMTFSQNITIFSVLRKLMKRATYFLQIILSQLYLEANNRRDGSMIPPLKRNTKCKVDSEIYDFSMKSSRVID